MRSDGTMGPVEGVVKAAVALFDKEPPDDLYEEWAELEIAVRNYKEWRTKLASRLQKRRQLRQAETMRGN